MTISLTQEYYPDERRSAPSLRVAGPGVRYRSLTRDIEADNAKLSGKQSADGVSRF